MQLAIANAMWWSLVTVLLAVHLIMSVFTHTYNLGLLPEMVALAALGYLAFETSRDRWTAALWQFVTIGILVVAAIRLVERKGIFAAQPYSLSGAAVAGGFVVIFLSVFLSGGLFAVRFQKELIAVNDRSPYRQSGWTSYSSAVVVALVAIVCYEVATLPRDGPGIRGSLTALVRLTCLAAIIVVRKAQSKQTAGPYVAELLRLLLIMWMLDWLRELDTLADTSNIGAILGLAVRLTLVSSLLYIEQADTAGRWEGFVRARADQHPQRESGAL